MELGQSGRTLVVNHHVGTRDLFRSVKTKIDPKSGIVALHANVALARVVAEAHALAVHVAIGLVTYRSTRDAALTCDSATAHSTQVQQRLPLTVVGAIDRLCVTPTPQLSHSRHNTRNTSPSHPALPGRIRCRFRDSRAGREDSRSLLGPSRCRWDNHQPPCRRGRCRHRSTLSRLESSALSTCRNLSKPRHSIHIERGAKERSPLREGEELIAELGSSPRGIRRKCYA